MIAEKDKAEDRGLDRLGLQIRRRHHERAVVHRQQHQSGGDDLAERAEQQPRPERRRSATADGRRSPISTTAKKIIENGKPNRKRILVAPQVPSGPVNCRCIALRATCPSAAVMVKGIQSVAMVNMAGDWVSGRRMQATVKGAAAAVNRSGVMTGLRLPQSIVVPANAGTHNHRCQFSGQPAETAGVATSALRHGSLRSQGRRWIYRPTPPPPPPCSSRPCRRRGSSGRRTGCRPRRPAR